MLFSHCVLSLKNYLNLLGVLRRIPPMNFWKDSMDNYYSSIRKEFRSIVVMSTNEFWSYTNGLKIKWNFKKKVQSLISNGFERINHEKSNNTEFFLGIFGIFYWQKLIYTSVCLQTGVCKQDFWPEKNLVKLSGEYFLITHFEHFQIRWNSISLPMDGPNGKIPSLKK